MGRQFISRFLTLRLPRRHKTTVQKTKSIFHTVVSKDDFSKLTVEEAKTFDNTVFFVVFQQLDDSRIQQSQLWRLHFDSVSALKRQSQEPLLNSLLSQHKTASKSRSLIARAARRPLRVFLRAALRSAMPLSICFFSSDLFTSYVSAFAV